MNQERDSLDETMGPAEIIGRGSPLRVLLTTALAIFAAEVLIMLIVAVFPPLRTWQVALLDSTLLVFVLSPLLYGLVFRPLTRLIKEREDAILALREEQQRLASAMTKVLSGYLPICASCKRIRGDDDEWTQVEEYVTQKTEAHFSHGICPRCAERLYPDLGSSPE